MRTEEKKAFTHYANGALSTGDAVIIENCNYPGGAPEVNIEGGSFSSAYSDAVSSVAYDDPASTAEEKPVTEFISGGSFTDKNGTKSDVSDFLSEGLVEDENGVVKAGALELTLSSNEADYNGKDQTPDITKVTFEGKTVTADSVSWSAEELINAGTYTVTAKYGAATGTAEFTINQLSLRSAFSGITAKDSVFTGSPQAPELVFKDQKNKVVDVAADEYTVKPASETNVGDYTVQIVGAEKNYFGTDSVSWSIEPADFKDVTISVVPDNYIFGNEDKYEPEVTVKLGDYELVEGTDYTVSYPDVTKAGDYQVTVTPAGNSFTGEAKTADFKVAASMASVTEDGKTTYYKTLAEAVAVAKTGTVTLLEDASGAGIFVAEAAAKDITIDLGGHTYTVSGPAVGSTGTENQGLHLEKGNKIIIKNGTVTSTEDSGVLMLVQNYADLTLEGRDA